MFLSNPRKSFLLALFCVILFLACGSSQSNENRPVSLTLETKSGFPFSTKEPDVYQGDFVIDGNMENRRSIAQKNGKRRIDFFWQNEPTVSVLTTDKSYSIDHRKRLYAIDEDGASQENDLALSDPNFSFFRGKEHRAFDEIGREGNLIIYVVRETDVSKGTILIYFDTAIGMIVKQEFKSPYDGGVGFHLDYVYEIRNVKLEVDDGVFAIPENYRKVGRADLWREKVYP